MYFHSKTLSFFTRLFFLFAKYILVYQLVQKTLLNCHLLQLVVMVFSKVRAWDYICYFFIRMFNEVYKHLLSVKVDAVLPNNFFHDS